MDKLTELQKVVLTQASSEYWTASLGGGAGRSHMHGFRSKCRRPDVRIFLERPARCSRGLACEGVWCSRQMADSRFVRKLPFVVLVKTLHGNLMFARASLKVG